MQTYVGIYGLYRLMHTAILMQIYAGSYPYADLHRQLGLMQTYAGCYEKVWQAGDTVVMTVVGALLRHRGNGSAGHWVFCDL